MFSGLLKAFVATTLFGNTSMGKAAFGVGADLVGSFLSSKQGTSSGTKTPNIQGAIEPSVFSFKDDLMSDDITVIDAVDLNTKFTSTETQNNFPLGSKLADVVLDPAFRRYMENSFSDNPMKTVSAFRDTATTQVEKEIPISIHNQKLLT